MPNHTRDPILLTPGPLTTSLQTKMAMLRDWARGTRTSTTSPPSCG